MKMIDRLVRFEFKVLARILGTLCLETQFGSFGRVEENFFFLLRQITRGRLSSK